MAYWTGTAAGLAAITDDWMIANGGTLNKSLYPELFTSIGYTYGGSGNNFKLPYMTDKKYVRCNGSAGTTIAASIPNITGTFPGVGQQYGGVHTNEAALSGAFYRENTSNKPANGVKVGNDGSNRDDIFNFYASRCSKVYNSGATTVTPYSMDMIPIIKIK